jgi:hypothetical protein
MALQDRHDVAAEALASVLTADELERLSLALDYGADVLGTLQGRANADCAVELASLAASVRRADADAQLEADE